MSTGAGSLRPMSGGDVERGAGDDLMDKVVNLCKRRGFVYQSAEIYGGFRSAYDYGPLGVLLLRNVKDAWWRTMVQLRTDVVGLDASILSPPEVWEASGHLTNFTDPLVDCRNCGTRHREDQLDDPEACPNCGQKGQLTEAREFNLMFRTQAGPVAGAGADVYLRPETAQGMFINFRQRFEHRAHQAAIRHRADRQVVPQRDHPGQLHLPHPGVRADGDGVLRTPRRGRLLVRVLVRCPDGLVHRPRHTRRQAAAAAPRRRRAEPLLGWDRGCGVHVPLGVGRARGHRQSNRLRPDPARRALRRRPGLLRPAGRRALLPPRDRAGRGGHPHDDGVSAGRLRRRGGAGGDPHRVAAPPPG